MNIYLVAHTNSKSTGIAQTEFHAISEWDVKQQFKDQYPDRTINVIHEKGTE